jgi:uncharacterized protein (DUF305 family)
MRHSHLYLSTLAMIIGLTACGLEFTSRAAEDGAATTVSDDGFNDRDVSYGQLMLPHSRQAVELANLALEDATEASDAVKVVATRIKREHASEIERMTLLLRGWKRPLAYGPTLDGVQLRTGILPAKHVSYITSLSGAAFDKEYMESMISHHEGSIDMARMLLLKGRSSSMRTLADAVIANRQTAIDEMNDLLS